MGPSPSLACGENEENRQFVAPRIFNSIRPTFRQHASVCAAAIRTTNTVDQAGLYKEKYTI
jgi:hypothetical protein